MGHEAIGARLNPLGHTYIDRDYYRLLLRIACYVEQSDRRVNAAECSTDVSERRVSLVLFTANFLCEVSSGMRVVTGTYKAALVA
jgi:hypothetical protein